MRKRLALSAAICVAIPLFAESVPVPRFSAPQSPVPTTARGDLGPALDFADAGSGRLDFDFKKLPAQAPTEPGDAAALVFPEQRHFALDFGRYRDKAGAYSGPDGGRVYQWSRSHYAWDMQTGARFIQYPNGTWTVEDQQAGHQIVQYGDGAAQGWWYWTFPDRAQIRKSRHPRTGNFEFFYTRVSDGRSQAFQMTAPDAKLYPLQRDVGILRLQYSQPWARHVEHFARYDRFDDFLRYMEESFGFRHPGRVPVRMFPELGSFRTHANNRSAGPGGYGGMFGVVMCCGDLQPPPESNPARAEALRRADNFNVILHEVTHNLQQNYCYARRDGRGDLPPEEHPGHWFIEGIADYAVMRSDARQRTAMMREFYERTDRGGPPSFEQLDYGNRRAYIFGRMMIYFLVERYGGDNVRKYYDATCLGTRARQAMRGLTGLSPAEVYAESLRYFQEQRPRLEARFHDWSIDGLHELAFAWPSADRTPPLLPKDLRSITMVPDIQTPFEIAGIENFYGASDLTMRTGEGHGVFVWKDKSIYMVYGKDFKVYVRPEETSMHRGGYVIINWASGQRRFTMPDGTYFHMWSVDKPAGYFSKSGQPLDG